MRRNVVRGLVAIGQRSTTATCAMMAMILPASASPHACEADALPKTLAGICQTPLFKAYVSCIKHTIPVWNPKGNVLKKEKDFPKASFVFAVLMECEWTAKEFGSQYGNNLANILQGVANQRVSKQFGAAPLPELSGDRSTFLEYGEHIDDPANTRRGDITVPYSDRTEIRRPPVIR
jgi:hypothetical protein